MNTFLIYLWSISENVQIILLLIGVVALIPLIPMIFVALEDDDEVMWRGAKKAGLVLGVSWALCAAIPDRAGIAAMVIVPRIAESETLKRDIPEIYQFAVERLRESLMKKPEKE